LHSQTRNFQEGAHFVKSVG